MEILFWHELKNYLIEMISCYLILNHNGNQALYRFVRNSIYQKLLIIDFVIFMRIFADNILLLIKIKRKLSQVSSKVEATIKIKRCNTKR